MSEPNVDIVSIRAERLRYLLGYLRSHGEVTADALTEDETLAFAIERVLAQIVEIAVDINTHILVSTGHSMPATSRDTFPAAAKYGVISMKLARAIAPSVGMRNLLIHEYLEIDLQRVADAVGHALTHYDSYVAAIDDWIAQHQ